MHFFKHQDQARRKTGILILFFVLAVILIMLAVNAVAFFIFSSGDDYVMRFNNWMQNTYWEHPTALAVLLMMFGSLNRYFELSSGGRAVAKMVSAKPVDLNSNVKNEIKYINIVSEMSIASGVPMPLLYVMDRESGINAFVAGFKPTEAVMVVTKGALESLSRDELQGVVAHEFSHILNGDMRINIRLMAILAGILTMGQFGKVLMFSSGRGRSSKNSGPLILIGLTLFLIGYIGLFFGRLIKSAISRQREYLADSSAVQFTRNPKGIAGALYRIKESVRGGCLKSNRAEEMSHMCFSNTLNIFFGSLLATHPDLDMRINAIDPSFIKIKNAKNIIKKREGERKSAMTGSSIQSSNLVNMIGNPESQHLVYAAMLYRSLSAPVMRFLHSRTEVQYLMYALIISGMERDSGLSYLSEICSQQCRDKTTQALELVEGLEKRQYLPVVDLSLPVLKTMNKKDKKDFVDAMDGLVKLDRRVTMFEFMLLVICKQHLDEGSDKIDSVACHSFKPVLEDIRLLISLMVQVSRQTSDKIDGVFKRAMKTFVIDDIEMIPVKECNFDMLGKSLIRLNGLSPLLKKSLITVCADCVIDDGVIMPSEGELLRAVAESLDCPMPPLLQS